MEFQIAAQRLVQVYEKASTTKSGKYYTTVNELLDQIPSTRPDTLLAAVEMILAPGDLPGNKILSEEDKGAVLAGLISVRTNLPLAMARWYVYPIPHATVVPLDMEYAKGQLLVNGIEKGDKLVIVDDTLATGGTVVSLIQAARMCKAVVTEVRVLVEKLGFGGRAQIESEGVPVKSAMGIEVTDGHVAVREILQFPVTRDDSGGISWKELRF